MTSCDVAPPASSTAPLRIDGFLSEAKCRAIRHELDFALWRPSTVVNQTRDGSLYSHTSRIRVSETTSEEWFTPELRRDVRNIARRVAKRLDVDSGRFEEWQAVRYRCGGRFDYHLDAGFFSSDAAGERQWTVLIYLDTPDVGGATRFKRLRLKFEAVTGRLLLWNNLLADGAPDPAMLHAGAPVRRGRKTILVSWIRERCRPPK
jgi:prolyl 4-hydroxylase